MSVQCEYCGGIYDAAEKNCPSCGARNPNPVTETPKPQTSGRTGKPTTIQELKDFCQSKGMPLEKMRFFIGEDYKAPRAFGIFQDESGQFVVYKNKADGSRAIRYQGPDEAYAVNELYQKLRSEIALRNGNSSGSSRSVYGKRQSGKARTFKGSLLIICLAIFVIMTVFNLIRGSSGPRRGYYQYNNDWYYYQNNAWYLFNTVTNDWGYATPSSDLQEHYNDYWDSSSYNSDYGVSDFSQSDYYAPSSSSYDDDDDDWDSDWDSWDSGDTDWDSDW